MGPGVGRLFLSEFFPDVVIDYGSRKAKLLADLFDEFDGF